ncbi:MAG: ornithine--oxo-acid transaminase [Georgfuchsia sp.]
MANLHRLPELRLIGVASALGAPGHGTEQGPSTLKILGVLDAPRRAGLSAQWEATIVPATDRRWPALKDLCNRLADTTAAVTADGHLPVVLGGDHTMAAGTWRGVARALKKPLGLVWIDAHLDAHTPDNSPTGNPHGMPLAALLGAKVAGLETIASPLLDPQRIALIGARSWENSELQLLHEFGVRIFPMDEIHLRGLTAVMDDALKVAQRGNAMFGISLDLDAIDPTQAPAVATPAPDGLNAAQLRQALRGLARHPDFAALEIAEYDPVRDVDYRSGRLIVDLIEAFCLPRAKDLMIWENRYGALNYAPMPVVLSRGKGCRVWDADGHRYLDMMAAYSALSFGHAHPRLVAALDSQARRLAVTSRAYYNDRPPLFLKRLTELFGYERALPVNTGLEAVETALKAARKWGYQVKGIADGKAEIIACKGNFHGRSIAIVGLSTEAQYRNGFGPFPSGLITIPYGDAAALEAAITPRTAAFLVEPIQCEGGIIVPPKGYLAACARICRHHDVLLVADEVQTGLGRTGRLLACEHDQVHPDGVILGKALGGGLLPVSAFLADDRVMRVFTPGDHGSTFGGNPLAAAVALEALALLEEEKLVAHAAKLGTHMQARLKAIKSPYIREVRGCGLLAGIDLNPDMVDAKRFCEILLQHGVLSKDTHETVARLAPPLIITRAELDYGIDAVQSAINELDKQLATA